MKNFMEMLLGSGMADAAAKSIKGRKANVDKAIDEQEDDKKMTRKDALMKLLRGK